MSLSLLILIFLFKNIEARYEGCVDWLDGSKIYECIYCAPGYKSVECPNSICISCCFICFKCEINYCNECTGNTCSKCLDGFYLNNNQCLFCDDNCETCSGSATPKLL